MYLRINDWSKTVLEYKKNTFNIEKDSSVLTLKNLQTCVKTDLANSVSKIEFKKIYDPVTYGDNGNLAMRMNLNEYLSMDKSILFITYGYSGVGKTFTVFGDESNPGVIQSAIQQLKNQTSVKYRAYEVYGLAVPYQFYWKKSMDEYHQFIYNYEDNWESKGGPQSYKSNEFEGFIKKLDSYIPITNEQLNNFADIIEKIDTYRKSVGRIRQTVNNIESSRSIMVIDLRIETTPLCVKFD